MERTEKDITQIVISSETVRQRIASIFPDSVIVDNKFRFVSISQNILESIRYTYDELKGNSLSILAYSCELQEEIEKRLRMGYFEEEQFELRTKNDTKITFGISGYYVGLIADINGMIVLKFRNLDEINLMYARLEAKTEELDRFVYLSSHALRGPLATMQGLLNLTKMSDDFVEIRDLISKVESFAEKLDDKLHRLILFAESDKGSESSHDPLCFPSICNILKHEISESNIGPSVYFNYKVQEPDVKINEGLVVLSLLRNLVGFICNLPRTTRVHVAFDALTSTSAIEIIIRANGFEISPELSEKLRTVNFGYSEILSYPELINCYAAKKVVYKLKGNIQFILNPPQELVILITLPLPN